MAVPTPGELLRQIPNSARRPQSLAYIRFAIGYLGYLLCVAGAVLAPGWALKALFVLATASTIGGLYVLGHDAGHGTLVPGHRANRWLARFAFFPTFTPLAAWFRAHVLLHHNFLRVRGRDMVWMPWTPAEYRAAARWRRVWYQFLRTPVGLAFYWTVGNWVPYLLFPPGSALGARRRQNHFDRAIVVVCVSALFAGLYGLALLAANWPWAEPVGPSGVILLGIVLPYLVWAYSIAVVDLVQHTHPRAIWFGDRSEWDYYTANVRSTVHMVLPFGLNVLLHNILEHTAHHIDPRVPLHQLPDVQARFEAAYPADVLVERFTPGYVLSLLRTCRLYDFEKRQWLDYDGTPTAPAQHPTHMPVIRSALAPVEAGAVR